MDILWSHVAARQVLTLEEVVFVLLELLLANLLGRASCRAGVTMPTVAHEEALRLETDVLDELSVRGRLAHVAGSSYVRFHAGIILHVEAREDSVADALQVVD